MAAQDVTFAVSCDPPLPEPMHVDLRRALGTCKVQRDWRCGRVCFSLPYPWHELRIYQGEILRGDKRLALAFALDYFSRRPMVTTT